MHPLFTYLLGLIILLSLTYVNCIGERHEIFNRSGPPNPWQCGNRAPKQTPHSFWIALKQQNIEELKQLLQRVSDPLSVEYGEYRTINEIEDLVLPLEEERDTVISWLKEEAVHLSKQKIFEIIDYGDALEVHGDIEYVEYLFQTKIHLCIHPEDVDGKEDTPLNRPKALGPITIPSYVSSFVEFVTGISDFHPPHVHRLGFKTRTLNLDSDVVKEREYTLQTNNYVYPVTTRILNSIPEKERVNHPLATQGVVEFGLVIPDETGQDGGGGGGFQFSDLQYFSDISKLPFYNISKTVGPFTQNNLTGNAESLLDTEYILALAPNADTAYSTYLVWMFEFAEKLFHDEDAPLVNSLSYATAEYLMCNTTLNGSPNKGCEILGVDAAGYIERANVEFIKLGVRGISLISASGDNGAPSENNKKCEKDNTEYPLFALFPASSPYVTAVGGIALVEQIEGKPDSAQPPICGMSNAGPGYCGGNPYTLAASSIVNGGITSGGGFSNYTARPWYQNEAVERYLASSAYRPPDTVFNKHNRAYPDIANLASQILIVENKKVLLGAGTSASTPMIAAIATLINSHLLSKGYQPLGLINPLIYQAAKEDPSIFVDVTKGNNTCTEEACCKYGYECAQGWDPVTGMGALNYPKIINYLDRLWEKKMERNQ